MEQKIWFITGISNGLGKSLAHAAMDRGDIVVGTMRQSTQVNEFNSSVDGKSYAVRMDVTNTADIDAAVEEVKARYGRIDVLVNNAGYGMAGAVEETDMSEARDIFEANFFGPLYLTNKVLPLMRHQGSGHIVQISSHGGFKAFAGFGLYNASKFALEGMSEALAAEVGPLGIKVTIVEPGPFRTGFAGAAFALAKNSIDDYAQTAGAFRSKIQAVHGKQEGDPDKAAQAICQLVDMPKAPLRLPLGKIALVTLQSKIDSVQADINAHRSIAEQAVYVQ